MIAADAPVSHAEYAHVFRYETKRHVQHDFASVQLVPRRWPVEGEDDGDEPEGLPVGALAAIGTVLSIRVEGWLEARGQAFDDECSS